MDARLSECIAACAGRTGRSLSIDELYQLARYVQLLAKWNETINLTGLPLDGFPASALDRLVGESLIASVKLPASGVWFDLGSGGGSPAVPLKIVQSGPSLVMVESRERKAAFLREVIRELELDETDVLNERFELLGTSVSAGTADVVTVRAVRMDANLVGAARFLLRSGGTLLMFSGQFEAPSTFGGFTLKSMLPLELTASVLLEYRAH